MSGSTVIVHAMNAPKAEVDSRRNTPLSANLSELEKQWGIKLLGIRTSAAGNMLDFRYRIMDVDKAQPLVDQKAQPYLINQRNGGRMSIPSSPTVGSLRQTSIKPLAERSYFALFANPGKQIKTGDKVTVVIGDFKAEDLIVE